MSRNDHKITVLQQIRDKKEILFGAFSDKLSKDKKTEEWKSILKTCQSLGLVPLGKDYSYVRDTFYSNLKRSTLSKRDNARKTGTGGGKKCIFTPIDDLILEIIGKDSPITDGISVKPTPSTSDAAIQDESDYGQNYVRALSVTPPRSKRCSSLNINEEKKVKIVRKGSKSHTDVLDQEAKKKRKLDLQLEFLELQNYKSKLEILEMERKLDVEPSKHTQEIKLTTSENSNQFLLITKDHMVINEDGTYSNIL